MKTKLDIGQSINLLANVGILVGLVLVGVQINQNTNYARLQLLNDSFAGFIEEENTMMGENPAAIVEKSLQQAEELTFD